MTKERRRVIQLYCRLVQRVQQHRMAQKRSSITRANFCALGSCEKLRTQTNLTLNLIHRKSWGEAQRSLAEIRGIIASSKSQYEEFLQELKVWCKPLPNVKYRVRWLPSEFDVTQTETLGIAWVWTTPKIYLKRKLIGPYKVFVPWSAFLYPTTIDIRIRNLNPKSPHEGYPHPHADRDGRFCLGANRNAMENCFWALDLRTIKDTIESLLSLYNPDSPFIKWTRWSRSVRSCSWCGEPVTEENGAARTTDGELLCSSCAIICPVCSRYVRLGSSLGCLICGVSHCNNCLSKCSICGRWICPKCVSTTNPITCCECRH